MVSYICCTKLNSMKYIKLYLLVAFLIVSCKTVQETSNKADNLVIPVVQDTREIQGGMWIPSLLEGINEQEMMQLGSKMTAKDIYDVNNSSLKDAIVHFNGGCTSEIISPNGLLLTNHHCGYGAIQSHSTVEHDYLENGFWAKSYEEELSNPSMSVTFIKRIDDVTAEVFSGITETMDEAAKMKLINQNILKVTKKVQKESWQDANVKSFYDGNQYLLFVTEEYKDVRLVGAPPSSIGKFGADTDNWMWPRHTGDFSMFRIYADKNNLPAKYSKENIPYTPKHFLPISLDGISEGDFTMVFGFPGRTNEYLPAVAIEQITQKVNPTNIAIREAALKVIDANMKRNDKIRIQYASKQARIANAWKKWIGENLGIEKSNAVEKRRTFESTFTKALKEKGLEAKYGDILPKFNRLYKDFAPVNIKRRNFIEVFLVTNELMQMTLRTFQMEQAINNDSSVFEKARESLIRRFKGIHKNYNVDVDKGVFSSVMPFYTDHVDDSIYNNIVLLVYVLSLYGLVLCISCGNYIIIAMVCI